MSYVYFIQQGTDGPIKIGFTESHPQERLFELQTGNPVALRLLTYREGTQLDESMLHARYHQSRLVGEWFTATEGLLAEIRTLMLRDIPRHTRPVKRPVGHVVDCRCGWSGRSKQLLPGQGWNKPSCPLCRATRCEMIQPQEGTL